MNDTPSSFYKKGRTVQFYAILALFFIGIFTYTISNGGLLTTISKFRQVAGIVASGFSPTPIKNNLDVAGSTINESASFVASSTTGNGNIISVSNIATSTPDAEDDDKEINSATTTTPSPIIVSTSTERGVVPAPNIIATTTPTPIIETKIVEETFSLDKRYESNLNIFPAIYKDNVRVYDNIKGTISIRVELPSSKAIILLGNKNGWMKDGIIRDGSQFKRVEGTNRFVLELDTKIYTDGSYKVGAAYFDINKGWILTSVFDFEITNNVKVATIAQATTSPIQVAQIAKMDTVREKPSIRLVVNDRQITDIRHTFNSEELELRVTNYPALSVQFFAYAEDGAFKPALKEIGKGGKDELLSRDGKEVWTYTTNMDEFPTGNFKLFARVKYIEGTLGESQPVAIIVQHLNKISENLEQNVVATNTNATNTTNATKESILKRVLNPSDCQNRQECEVFCSSINGASNKCIDYVRSNGKTEESVNISKTKENQENVIANFTDLIPKMLSRIDGNSENTPIQSSSTDVSLPAYSGRPSIIDAVPTSIIEKIINSKKIELIDLPDEVKSASDFQQYCGITENEDKCLKTINDIVPELNNNIQKQVELVRSSEDKTRQLIEQRSGARAFIDSDDDGVSDFDEVNFYNTDPAKRDSNGDGFSDGAAILGQMNTTESIIAVDASSSNILLGKGVYVENPKITGSTQSAQFKVTDVAVAAMKENSEGKDEVSKIAFKGVALPNSFVKIFLFSEPVVVTVKADDNGNWSYVLDKTLPDGTHTAYVAMTDNGGRILAKSAPLPFVKEASAITLNEAGVGDAGVKSNTFMGLSPVTLIALLVGILGLALSVVGVVIGFRNKSENTPNITPSI